MKIGIKGSDLCTFCDSEEGILIYLFRSYRVTSDFGKNLINE